MNLISKLRGLSKTSLAVGLLSLAGLGYEGWQHLGHTQEVKAIAAAVEAMPADATQRTTFKIAGTYVTQGGLLLCNSERDFKSPTNVTLTIANSGFDRNAARQLVGKTFEGEVTKGSYQGKAQLNAVQGKYTIK